MVAASPAESENSIAVVTVSRAQLFGDQQRKRSFEVDREMAFAACKATRIAERAAFLGAVVTGICQGTSDSARDGPSDLANVAGCQRQNRDDRFGSPVPQRAAGDKTDRASGRRSVDGPGRSQETASNATPAERNRRGNSWKVLALRNRGQIPGVWFIGAPHCCVRPMDEAASRVSGPYLSGSSGAPV
ncbi:MAG TPA: hypothetical protein DIU07_13475 [Rhodobacteraceae bacterium]|nr:hypothetical protein [Paracoccaceae bacterium]